MTKYLLDTNHASRLMNQDERLIIRVRHSVQSGDAFGISITVLGELYFAVFASQHRAQNLQRLTRLLATLHIYPFDQPAAEDSAVFKQNKKLRAVPSVR